MKRRRKNARLTRNQKIALGVGGLVLVGGGVYLWQRQRAAGPACPPGMVVLPGRPGFPPTCVPAQGTTETEPVNTLDRALKRMCRSPSNLSGPDQQKIVDELARPLYQQITGGRTPTGPAEVDDVVDQIAREIINRCPLPHPAAYDAAAKLANYAWQLETGVHF